MPQIISNRTIALIYDPPSVDQTKYYKSSISIQHTMAIDDVSLKFLKEFTIAKQLGQIEARSLKSHVYDIFSIKSLSNILS